MPIYDDIKKLKGSQFGSVDIITGGFPCQGFSVAGKRKGKEDHRYLWPEMFRVIQEAKPNWVIGENVTGIIDMALDTVLFDLENEGYETQTFIIPACSQNAPHKRERVWIVANSIRTGAGNKAGKVGGQKRESSPNRTSDIRQRNGEIGTGGVVSTGEILANSVNGEHRGWDRSQGEKEKIPGVDRTERRSWGIGGTGEVLADTQGGESGQQTEQKRREDTGGRSKTISNADKLNGNESGFRTSEIPQFETSEILPMPDWNVEPAICRVVDGLSSILDRNIKEFSDGNDNECYTETITKIDNFRREVLREMWGENQKVKPTPLQETRKSSSDFMHDMSCRRTHERWKLGQRFKEDKILCNMWTRICSQPFKETQELQQGMLEHIREAERNEKVGKNRTDRLKGLGNSIVPQVAAVIMQAIKEIDTVTP